MPERLIRAVAHRPTTGAPGLRRSLLLGIALAALAGCSTPPQRTHFDSLASYGRTFDIALGAMADQKMIFSVQDRRHGNIVAERNGDVVTATLQPQFDGTIRVTFNAPNPMPADPELLKRVITAYNERMAQQARILPGGTL
jgi:hypothetical protein